MGIDELLLFFLGSKSKPLDRRKLGDSLGWEGFCGALFVVLRCTTLLNK